MVIGAAGVAAVSQGLGGALMNSGHFTMMSSNDLD
jgi:hypothetical protein